MSYVFIVAVLIFYMVVPGTTVLCIKIEPLPNFKKVGHFPTFQTPVSFRLTTPRNVHLLLFKKLLRYPSLQRKTPLEKNDAVQKRQSQNQLSITTNYRTFLLEISYDLYKLQYELKLARQQKPHKLKATWEEKSLQLKRKRGNLQLYHRLERALESLQMQLKGAKMQFRTT